MIIAKSERILFLNYDFFCNILPEIYKIFKKILAFDHRKEAIYAPDPENW